MAPRSELQTLFQDLLSSSNVYFQPPANVEILYPCIVYSRDLADTKFADNAPYSHVTRYKVTVIDRDPDGSSANKVAKLPMCVFVRFFTKDNLNHDVYQLYY